MSRRRRVHWTEDAERVTGPGVSHLMGEDDNGDLYVPSLTRTDWWDRHLNLRDPRHWRYWLASRITRQLVWLEPYP